MTVDIEDCEPVRFNELQWRYIYFLRTLGGGGKSGIAPALAVEDDVVSPLVVEDEEKRPPGMDILNV